MSRRKLRLGRRKKSLERQKPKVLTVSIPRAAVSVQQHPGLFCSPSLSNALQHSVHIDQPVSQLTVYEWPSDIYDFALTPLSILKLPPQWVIPSMTTVVFVQSRAARSLPSKCHFVNSITGRDYYNFIKDIEPQYFSCFVQLAMHTLSK
eukprot:Em0007g713a